MNYTFFVRPKLWLNIISSMLCYFMCAYELRVSILKHRNILGALLFLIFAVNGTSQFISYHKLERIRKSASSEEEVVRAERCLGLVFFIFSNAAASFYMLLMTIAFLCSHLKDRIVFTIICAILTLCFTGL